MTSPVEELLREAERLTPEEQEALALCLLDGLHRDPEQEIRWAAEIERRMKEVRDGRVEWVAGKDVLAMLDAVISGDGRLPADTP